jgi:hypothetical protein
VGEGGVARGGVPEGMGLLLGGGGLAGGWWWFGGR